MENVTIAKTMIECIDKPQLALGLYLQKPEINLMGFKAKLEEVIMYSEGKLAEIDIYRTHLEALAAFGPVPPSPKPGFSGGWW